ncbi:MAG: class II fructose-bisphosphatase [Actinomycetota bacterium]|nr:class II fructose-bisphosphatase [Actinomycetota bacterium]
MEGTVHDDALADALAAPSAHTRWLASLEPVALEATRAAAVACQPWVGRGSPDGADEAATEAMRTALGQARGPGTVVVGEGEKDDAPMLFDGERLGANEGPAFDIAVDPLECTKLCARGLTGSLTTIAFAARGTMASIAGAFYMDKLIGPPATRGALDLAAPVELNLQHAGEALGKAVGELRIVVLDKPRHKELIERLHRAGAEVSTPPDGDVAAAVAVLLPDGGADLQMGIGGTPEGIMTACAVRALGGFMQGQLAPQGPEEAEAIAAAGLDSEHVYKLEQLAAGDGLFVATGVTGGDLLRRPWFEADHLYTESLIIAAGSARRVLEVRRAPGAQSARNGATTQESRK